MPKVIDAPEAVETPIPGMIEASQFENASNRVLLAGLLADQPELRSGALSIEGWEAKLATYGKTERI